MNWSYRIGYRNRIAFALAAVFLIIVLANWLVSYNMTQVSRQFKSVYADRLVPALDISAMQERYYQNRLLLEEHLLADEQEVQQVILSEIEANERELDSLVLKFQATYLTNQESQDLKDYIKADTKYRKVQQTILILSHTGDKAGAATLYKEDGRVAFQNLLRPLHALSSLQ
ncbi:MAG: MCP four helix bundle domain-containing protein, partial [Pontibacter sp.]|nr:MCP four helix bundle domain-containing protein [Pontibacter sp.]